MHPIMMKVLPFLELETKDMEKFNQLLFDNMALEMRNHVIRHLYEDGPRKFGLRMSNIGRPLCQLQMEASGAKPLMKEYNFPLRMLFGSMIESMAVAIMKAAGVNIEEEQGRGGLTFDVDGKSVNVPGTFDLIIDGKMYDLKSASPYSYQKFVSGYHTLKENDSFGYVTQLYGYAWAKQVPPGGWIVIDKSSGEWCVCEVPEDYREDQMEALRHARSTAHAIETNQTFKRCFSDKEEVFNRKVTGNRVLGMPCSMCDFRFHCWPGLKYTAVPASKASSPPMKYYTKLVTNETPVSES